jgi:hypothetical protein
MVDFNDYADQLQQEVVAEIAESYFGDRKNLDDMMADFKTMADELNAFVPRLTRAATRLHHLLLDRASAADFYIALEVDPQCVPFTDEPPAPFFSRLPFAFTGAGRYEKCVRRSYGLFQKIVSEYLYGRSYAHDEDTGRKRQTTGYIGLREFARVIDGEVSRVNRNRAPTGTLRYVKGMDPVQAEREKILGDVTYVDGGGLDQSLRFVPVGFEQLGFPEMQDLPPLSAVKDEVKAFGKTLYRARKGEARQAMKELVI